MDCGDHAILVCSASGTGRGSLWFARFELCRTKVVAGDASCRSRAAAWRSCSRRRRIQVVSRPRHVARRGLGGRWTLGPGRHLRPDESGRPFLCDTLPLDNSQGGGVSQLTKSKACWSAFTRLDADEYLLFVGGRDNASQEGWFYRYTPRALKKWTFEGNFAGAPVSTVNPAWGPHNGATFVQTATDPGPRLLGFGSQGTSNGDEYRPRLRCFAVQRPTDGATPAAPSASPSAPATSSSTGRASERWESIPRWGTTAFVEVDGRLCLYVSERNGEPPTSGRRTSYESWN